VVHSTLDPTIEITREAAGSTILQRVSLPQGASRVDVETVIDWRSPNTLLKAVFPLAASNPKATYDLGLGTIQRGNNTPKAYEVPAQQWADITDVNGTFGAAIATDSKYGWDKPADNVLRLTLLHTPLPRATPYQGSNDLGHHRFVYSIVRHPGDWRQGRVPARAAELNSPLRAFQTDAHAGPLGRAFALATLSDATGQTTIRALKQAEDSDEIVVRLQELYGQPGQSTLMMAGSVTTAREIDAAEEPIASLPVKNGAVTLDFTPYQPRTIAVRVARRTAAPNAPAPRTSESLSLPFDLDGISTDKNPADGDFDGKGHTLSGDLLPHQLVVDGVPFTFGSTAPGAKNVVIAAGQSIPIPAGSFDRVYVVAASVGGDARTTFSVARDGRPVVIPEWEGAVGQWDSRLKAPGALREPFVPSRPNGTPTLAEVRDGMAITWDPQTFKVDPAEIANLTPGFAKRTEIAWIGSHRHSPTGNQTYIQSYLFLLEIRVPPGTRSISLPQDSRVRILAMTAATGPAKLQPAAPLYSADLPEPATAPASGRGGGGR
jgi:alpha-mannosidase